MNVFSSYILVAIMLLFLQYTHDLSTSASTNKDKGNSFHIKLNEAATVFFYCNKWTRYLALLVWRHVQFNHM